MAQPVITIARGSDDLAAAANLFTQYATWLADDYGISLRFQNFEEEVSTLPGKYAPPSGELFLVRSEDNSPLGCIAFRKIDNVTCEIKRLFVAPAGRGQKLGGKLVKHCLQSAKSAGYSKAVLDTAGWMKDAQALYERHGFSDIEPYYHNPVEGVRFMGANL